MRAGSVVAMPPGLVSPPTPREVRRALDDRAVRRAVWRAVRDDRLRAAFARLRSDGLTVEGAVERLRGPHADEHGRPYFLSDERVRAIVYRKGDAGRTR